MIASTVALVPLTGLGGFERQAIPDVCMVLIGSKSGEDDHETTHQGKEIFLPFDGPGTAWLNVTDLTRRQTHTGNLVFDKSSNRDLELVYL